jgi:hypothetical protein
LEPIALSAFDASGVLRQFGLRAKTLRNFIQKIEEQYKDRPYHNRLHAADVTQATLCFLREARGSIGFSELEFLTALFAAACHDVGHPGVTNDFRISVADEDAITYNDRNVNEMMHAALAYRTLGLDNCDWLVGLNKAQLSTVRKGMIDIILCTDMSNHFKKLGEVKSAVEVDGTDVTKWDDRAIALEWLVHSADISSTGRPRATAEKWTDRVLQEFFAQGDRERSLGLPVSPLCDRRTVVRADAQCGFLKFIVLPAYDATNIICNVHVALDNMRKYYEDYADQAQKAKTESEKKNVKSQD